MKYELQKQVCKMAHFISKNYELDLEGSFKIAWNNQLLLKNLKAGGVHFRYVTEKGYLKQTFGTLNNIENKIKGTNGNMFKNDKKHIRYFDLEKQEFRTFEIINLIDFKKV